MSGRSSGESGKTGWIKGEMAMKSQLKGIALILFGILLLLANLALFHWGFLTVVALGFGVVGLLRALGWIADWKD